MGEHVSKAAEGLYLVITDSVAPYAVGKFTGSLIEIFLSKMKKTRLFDLRRFKKEVESCADIEGGLDEAFYDLRNLKHQKKEPRDGYYKYNYAQDVYDPFDYNVNYTEFYNSIGF